MIDKYEDLESNFPSRVDNFDRMQDLNTTTKPMADTYYEYLNANNISAAIKYLESNPELALSVFNAVKYNKLIDSIVATQRFFRDDIDKYMAELSDKESVDGGDY